VATGRKSRVSTAVGDAFTGFGFHVPRVRGAEQHEAAPLELFYDLVFVFAVTQVSDLLVEDLSWTGAGHALVALLVVWWAWDYTVWVTSEVETDQAPVRVLLLAMMLASLAMAVAVPEAFGQHGLLFAGAYVAIKGGRLLFLTFDTSTAADRSGRGRRLVIWFIPSSVLWIAGGLADGSTRTGLWTAALALDLAGPLALYWVPRRGRLPFAAWSTKTSHFVERFALFILIALGETIALTGATTSKLNLSFARSVAFTLAFLATAALWWLYFDGFRRIAKLRLLFAPNPVQLARDAYMYLHVVLVAGVILSAVGDELVIAHPTNVLAEAKVVVVAAGPAIYLLGQVLVRLRLLGRIYWERLGGTVACVIVGVIGTAVPSVALATLLVAVLVAVIALEQVRTTRRRARGTAAPFDQPEAPAALQG
jgi:low temperature requirement protein LtrA